MVAIGCLLLVVLPIVGCVAALLIWGAHAAIWGALGGLAVALVPTAMTGLALVRSRRH